MHGANLDHMANLLALQDTVATTTGHASNVEQLGTIDHVVIYSLLVVSSWGKKKKKKNQLSSAYPLCAQHTRLWLPLDSRDFPHLPIVSPSPAVWLLEARIDRWYHIRNPAMGCQRYYRNQEGPQRD